MGFTTRGLAVDLALATGRALMDFPQYINSDLVFSDLNFGPLCSEIATVKVVIANIAFSDYLVAIPSGNLLDLATSIGFCDLDPRDGGWSQKPMWTVLTKIIKFYQFQVFYQKYKIFINR